MGGGDGLPSERSDPAARTWEGFSDEERDVLLKVAEVLKKLHFGTVLLIVQDGKVVQIEMAEKIRLR